MHIYTRVMRVFFMSISRIFRAGFLQHLIMIRMLSDAIFAVFEYSISLQALLFDSISICSVRLE